MLCEVQRPCEDSVYARPTLEGGAIVGAGPTGLAAALFLSRRGVPVRIIDQAAAPARHSKALAVNPRTLDLLEPTGVSARMMAEGRAVHRGRFYENWMLVADLDLGGVHRRYALTVLSQARSEALLAEALAAAGIQAEREVTLEHAGLVDGRVEARLVHGNDGRVEQVSPPILFAADGARSTVRRDLGLGFPGSRFPEPWPLLDVRLDTPLSLDGAHISSFPDGLIFMLALAPGAWRVLGNVPDLLARLPPGTKAGEVLWESRFHIAHRVVTRPAVGRIALGGDAAHIHAPVGARGLNLGIEDAYVFAACAADVLDSGDPSRLADYGRLRHRVHRGVVRRVALMTRLVRGRPAPVAELRRLALPRLARFAPTAQTMARVATGLDHAVRTE